MPAHHYKSEELHQKHLAWRREYYKRNREKIRARDNAAANRRYAENPEPFKEAARRRRQALKDAKAAEQEEQAENKKPEKE